MPKEAVYKLTCERCGRTWYPSVSEGEPVTASASIHLVDSTGCEVINTSYDVLCAACDKTVGNYLSQIAKLLYDSEAKKKRKRKSKEPKAEEAVPAATQTQPPVLPSLPLR